MSKVCATFFTRYMQNLFLILTALSVHIFAWLTPGPIFVLIVRNSLLYSRTTGIWTAVGIALGNITHITYSITWLALIISSSTLAFNSIKYLGIAYLLYLWVKTLTAKTNTKATGEIHSSHKNDLSPLQAIKIGFLTNILSPKASLFFMSIFATIMTAHPPKWVLIALLVLMPLNSLCMATLYSYIFTQKKVLSTYASFQKYINWLLWGSLIVLAVSIALK